MIIVVVKLSRKFKNIMSPLKDKPKATKVHKTSKQKQKFLLQDWLQVSGREVNQNTIIAITIMSTKKPKTGIDSFQNFENRFILIF